MSSIRAFPSRETSKFESEKKGGRSRVLKAWKEVKERLNRREKGE